MRKTKGGVWAGCSADKPRHGTPPEPTSHFLLKKHQQNLMLTALWLLKSMLVVTIIEIAVTASADTKSCFAADALYARLSATDAFQAFPLHIKASEGWRKLDPKNAIRFVSHGDVNVFDAVELTVLHPLTRFVALRRWFKRMSSGIPVTMRTQDGRWFDVADLHERNANHLNPRSMAHRDSLRASQFTSAADVSFFS
jgi:hypothetical protein